MLRAATTVIGLERARSLLWSIIPLCVSVLACAPTSRCADTCGNGKATMISKDAYMSVHLLVDGSRINGKVSLVALDESGQSKVSTLAIDVERFNATQRGDYLYKARAGGWWRGSIRNLEPPAAIVSPPSEVEFAALSPDAAAIVWSVKENDASALVLSNPAGLEQKEIKRARGVVRQPSWSPNATRLAYYWGDPDVLITDAFTLREVSVSDADDRELALPSKPTGITAERTYPPQWSPDGSMILFLGNYELDDRVQALGYVVRADGSKGVKRVGGGVWSTDGSHLLYVRRTQLPFGPFVLSAQDVSTGASQDIDIGWELPTSAAGGRWSANRSTYAFTTNENELCIIEITKKRTSKLNGFPVGANLIWIERAQE